MTPQPGTEPNATLGQRTEGDDGTGARGNQPAKSKPSRALSDWAAICKYGRIDTWRPECEAGGDVLDCDWSTLAHIRVEKFFGLKDYRKRWRSMARAVALADRSPTMREKPEWEMFATTFRRWWRVNGLAEPPKEKRR